MELPFFGEIDLDSLEELYEVDFKLNDQKNCPIELWFDSEEISIDKMQPVLDMLQILPDQIKSAKEFLFVKEKGRNTLLKYLNHHINVLGQSGKESLGILESDNLETQMLKLEEKVHLKSISIWPENDEIMRVDYTIGYQITDYVICIGFNAENEIENIAIES